MTARYHSSSIAIPLAVELLQVLEHERVPPFRPPSPALALHHVPQPEQLLVKVVHDCVDVFPSRVHVFRLGETHTRGLTPGTCMGSPREPP